MASNHGLKFAFIGQRRFVVTDPKRAATALKWGVDEMERRYALFAKVGTRNFDGFNAMRAKAREAQELAEAELEEPELELAHHVKLSDDLETEGGFAEEELTSNERNGDAVERVPTRCEERPTPAGTDSTRSPFSSGVSDVVEPFPPLP